MPKPLEFEFVSLEDTKLMHDQAGLGIASVDCLQHALRQQPIHYHAKLAFSLRGQTR